MRRCRRQSARWPTQLSKVVLLTPSLTWVCESADEPGAGAPTLKGSRTVASGAPVRISVPLTEARRRPAAKRWIRLEDNEMRSRPRRGSGLEEIPEPNTSWCLNASPRSMCLVIVWHLLADPTTLHSIPRSRIRLPRHPHQHRTTSPQPYRPAHCTVSVDLVAGGASTVTIPSDAPIGDDQITAASEDAGDNTCAPTDKSWHRTAPGSGHVGTGW
ncbi:hypothetical protein VIMS_04284 [Mycobacterium marinum]|nr:hypothetical protein VIMS_04284 [Mycobacterium marinum]